MVVIVLLGTFDRMIPELFLIRSNILTVWTT